MSKTITETNSWASYSKPIQYQQIEWELGNLIGRVLTIIDASIIGQQNKAIKDLVKQEFRFTFNDFQREASEGKAGHSVKALID